MTEDQIKQKAKRYAREEVYYGAYVDEEVGIEIAEEAYFSGATETTKELEKENAKLKDVIKLLIATLNDTTWDEGHPGYSDSEPQYNCPQCSCKDCYRVSCQFNESELFKKLYKEFPELYENRKEK